MKTYLAVNVRETHLPSDLALLVECLEPDDLPRIERAYRGLSGLHAVLSQLLAPKSAPSAGAQNASELNDLERHVLALEMKLAEQAELIGRTADEVAGLHTLALAQAERIAVQSEMLARRAEAAAAKPALDETPLGPQEYVPTCGSCPADLTDPESIELGRCFGCRQPPAQQRVDAPPVTVIDDPEADLAPKDLRPFAYDDVLDAPLAEVFPEPAVEKSPAGATDFRERVAAVETAIAEQGTAAVGLANRLAIARALANGPLTVTEIIAKSGVPRGTVSPVLTAGKGREWFVKGEEYRSPYSLTDIGRAALKEAGYVLVPTPEVSPPVGPRSASVSEPTGPNPPPVAETSPPAPKRETPAAPALLPMDERSEAQCRLIAEAIESAGGKALLADEIARGTGLPPEVVQKRLTRHGPSAPDGAKRYFARSLKDHGLWLLTNSGEKLAKEGAQSA